MDETKPVISDDPFYMLLRDGKIEDFNAARDRGETISLSGMDLRGLDLRCINTKGLDMSNCYFRQADLRGVDLSEANLDGASIHAAKISGCLFPKALSADEIRLSLEHGIRMRYR
jgi:uncharacterized protein YjbI with pentapeptide repeats